jgi:hypothetical protein
MFEDLRQKISVVDPELIVVGENYPLPMVRMIISKCLTLLQFGILIVAVGGNFLP